MPVERDTVRGIGLERWRETCYHKANPFRPNLNHSLVDDSAIWSFSERR